MILKGIVFFLLACSVWLVSCSHEHEATVASRDPHKPLTVIAIGDVGESGGDLNANAYYITEMYKGIHDAGVVDAMIFLGDNFYPTGLNVPFDDIDGEVGSILGRFRDPINGLGRENVYAIPGNHDYYERNALEKSMFFGLITISAGPIGLTSKGNAREKNLKQWTYFYEMPGEALYPLTPSSTDSVQFLFVDSALPLRIDTSLWRPALDSLTRLLSATRGRPGIVWRILCLHQPFYSVGKHGGYTLWDEELQTLQYRTSCDKDTNAIGWLLNMLDPEDLCTAKYRQYIDSVKAAIQASGAKVQVALSGHDHSLQLLYYPDRDRDCPGCPKVHVISGAGSVPSPVKIPTPPYEYTSAQIKKEGMSPPGFAQLMFEGDRVRIVFYNANNGNRIDMGGGQTAFWINQRGELEEQ